MKFNRHFLFGAAVAVFLLAEACSPVSKYIYSEDVLSWEGDIALFDSLNTVEPSDQETILVTGSSSIRLWDSIHTDLAPYKVMQRGYGGARLSDFNYYAERIIQPHPFKAIVVFVANDISGGENDRTPKEVLLLYKTLIKQIRERNPGTPVFWIETTPTPSRWHASPRIREASGLIKKYCSRNPDLYFIDTYQDFLNSEGLPDQGFFREDMLHLNREGYLHWTQIIRRSLESAGIHPSS
jgi:lysophospholipase L1-like esterase